MKPRNALDQNPTVLLFSPVICHSCHKTIASRIVTSNSNGFPCLGVYNWACSIKAFWQASEASCSCLVHCQTTFFPVHFCCFGISQVVPHSEGAGGVEGEEFIGTNFCQQQNVSDVMSHLLLILGHQLAHLFPHHT